MASILIYPAIVAFVTVACSSARRWLLVGSVALVACMAACGSFFSSFEFGWPTSILADGPLANVSPGSGALQAGVFGPLADLRVLGLGLVAVIVIWIATAWPTWNRGGEASSSERFQGLLTIGILAVLAWVLFSYQF